MDRKTYRSLAYATLLATSVGIAPQAALAAVDGSDGSMAGAVEERIAEAQDMAAGTDGMPANAETGATPEAAPAEDDAAEPASAPTGTDTAAPADETGTGAASEAAPAEGDAADPAGAPAGTPAPSAGPQATPQDNRTMAWQLSRPEEALIRESMAPFENEMVAEVILDGAGETTEPTVQAALSLHAGDTFTAKAIEEDREAILYTGYFYDLYPSFERVPEGVVVTYHLLENPVLKDVIFTGNEVEKTEDLEKLLTVRKGAILNTTELHENVGHIQERYRKDGYILAKIMDMNLDPDGVLTLKINEGMLEGYAVKGNKKTKDRVILREMRQKPGTPFDAKLARRSMQRVYNLGFFEDVNIKMNPGVEPNAVIMEVEVKEKRTGTFGLGAGYSSEDGVIGMVSISDTNFRGRGDAISLTYEQSGDDTDAHGYTFSFRKPWLDSKETALTLRIYNRTYDYDDYDTDGKLKEEYMRKYKGGEFTLSRPVSEYSTNYITFRNRKDGYVRHVSGGRAGNRSTPAWADWRRDNFGTTRSLTWEHVTDTRDNIHDPTTGGRVNISVEAAGFMGGDFDFQKYTIEDRRYFKIGHAQVLALRGQYGIGHGDISEFNQYRLGGQDTLRGYRDAQFRGDRSFLSSVEYRFPLVKRVQGAVFTDWGAAWDTGFVPKNFHGCIGAGLGISTPLGAVRIDYGYGSQGGRVHFSVGGMF